MLKILKLTLLAVLLLLLVLVVVFVLRLALLAADSADGRAPGLMDGRLSPCPASPNCVNSEYPGDSEHLTAPVTLTLDDPARARQIARQVIQGMGGEVVRIEDHYLAATFTSSLFRFVDDFEVRLDSAEGLLHLRSASRVGYGDMGVNAERAERFKTRFAKQVPREK